MHILQELAFIVTKSKLRAAEQNSIYTDSRLMELYEGMASRNFETDEDAVYSIFGAKQADQNYHKLKSTLKSRLVDYLFLIDLNRASYNERQRAYYACYKNWAAVKILLGKNARNAAVSLSLSILKQAQRFEFTELSLDICRILRLHFGTRKGNIKKYEQYNALFKEYEGLWMAENRAEELYTELVVFFVNARASQPEISQSARMYYEEISGLLARFDSYRLRFSGYFILLTQYMSNNDYKNTITVAEEAIHYFESKDYQATAPLLIFLYQQLVCYIQLKEYEAGRKTARRCLELTEEGSFNWFKFQENYFLLAMHSCHYQEAYHILMETQANKHFVHLPQNILEIWKIFQAYLHYLALLGIVNPEEEEGNHKFRLQKFLNDVPIFSKDKQGMNVPILIIQVLFLIHQQRFEIAADRIECVRKYASRYLVNDGTYRSNCFIKMLHKLPAAHYHKQAVIRKANPLVEKLEAAPLNVAGQAHDIEIIPYEKLWELLLNSLDRKFHRGRQTAANR